MLVGHKRVGMNPLVAGVAQVKQVVLVVCSSPGPGEQVVDDSGLACADSLNACFAVPFRAAPCAPPFSFHIALFETRFDFQWRQSFLCMYRTLCSAIILRCRGW